MTAISQVHQRIIGAVGIPHERGQAEIEIPEKLRHYDKLRLSKEYRERVAQAIAERKKDGI
jgi:hypothetical protein